MQLPVFRYRNLPSLYVLAHSDGRVHYTDVSYRGRHEVVDALNESRKYELFAYVEPLIICDIREILSTCSRFLHFSYLARRCIDNDCSGLDFI